MKFYAKHFPLLIFIWLVFSAIYLRNKYYDSFSYSITGSYSSHSEQAKRAMKFVIEDGTIVLIVGLSIIGLGLLSKYYIKINK